MSASSSAARLLGLLGLLGLHVGCGGTSVAGQVTDVTGAPLAGATVTVVGTLCQTTSEADGAFELACQPGEWKIAIAQKGYLSKEVDLQATEARRYDLGAKPLIEIPEGNGLFLLRDGRYSRLEQGLLQRETKGPKDSPSEMSYCVDREGSTPVAISAGLTPFFDKAAPDWRVWKLDETGCAYRKARIDSRWEKTWGEQASTNRTDVGSEQAVVLVTFEPGEYFVADWKAGFFNEAPATEQRPASDDRRRYSGYLVAVQ